MSTGRGSLDRSDPGAGRAWSESEEGARVAHSEPKPSPPLHASPPGRCPPFAQAGTLGSHTGVDVRKGIALTDVSVVRRCSRTACRQPAVFTLTYVYADSTAVVGPLAAYIEPHCYDLCAMHAERLTAPLGWEVVRLPADPGDGRGSDDLEALANAVREAARPPERSEPVGQGIEVHRRGHLRMVKSDERHRPGSEPGTPSPPPD